MRAAVPPLLLLLVAACASAPVVRSTRPMLTGTVTRDGTGAPVRAYVQLENSVWGTSTDSLGRYALGPIPVGSYRVAVRPVCLDSVVTRRDVVLTDTATVEVHFRLALDPSYQCPIVEIVSP